MKIEYQRPKLYAKQREAFFNDRRYSLIEATSKAGKTVGAMAWLVEKTLFAKAGQNFWWVAPVYPQAEIAFRRVKRGMSGGILKANNGDLFLDFPSGSRLWFKSGEKPDNLYGEDVFAAVIDEASRVREESWHAVRSTLTATNGQIRLIGNVKGRQNWFYKLARLAEIGDPAMYYAKITALDAIAAGIITQAEIDDARRVLPDAVFRELYMAEPADDGGNPFGYSAIKACVAPLSSAKPVAFGVDLAKSVDWTVVIGLDVTGHVCRYERWQAPWNETVRRVREICGAVPTLYDSTGVGDPVGEQLQVGRGNFEGFKFSSSSKQQLMEGLAVAIQNGDVRYPDSPIVAELELYEYEYTRTGVRYSAPAGFHDDCVCALALAVRRKTTPVPGIGYLDYYASLYEAKEAKLLEAAR